MMAMVAVLVVVLALVLVLAHEVRARRAFGRQLAGMKRRARIGQWN